MHPSKDIIGGRGRELTGKTIVLCITGSVAAVKCPEIARELMRRGAEVFPVMSEAALGLITADLVEWATGNEVVTKLTGKIEHVSLGQKADLVLVCPATANTLSKIACGIDDTPVTSVVSVALGLGRNVTVVPAMHYSMYGHPALKENLKKLKKMGISVIEPRHEEGRAKVATTSGIVDFILRALGKNDFAGKRILVTAGPTIEQIDPMRVITNRSSGRMGLAIARAAWLRGAEITLACNTAILAPDFCRMVKAETAEDMKAAVLEELKREKYDAVIMAAAPADFALEKTSDRKIDSDKPLTLKLKPTEKIIDSIKKVSPSTFLVIFKAESGLSEKELAEKAFERLRKSKADLVVANDAAIAGKLEGDMLVMDKNRQIVRLSGKKEQLASGILDVISMKVRLLKNRAFS